VLSVRGSLEANVTCYNTLCIVFRAFGGRSELSKMLLSMCLIVVFNLLENLMNWIEHDFMKLN